MAAHEHRISVGERRMSVVPGAQQILNNENIARLRFYNILPLSVFTFLIKDIYLNSLSKRQFNETRLN